MRASHFRRAAAWRRERSQAAREASANWQSTDRRKHISPRWLAWHAGHGRNDSRAGFGGEGTAPFRAERAWTYTDKALWLLSCLDFDHEANLAGVSSNEQAAALIVIAHIAYARFEHRAFIKTGELQRATS
jgi:hypothetical protein